MIVYFSAGLNVSIISNPQGFEIKFSGYNDKMPLLIDVTLQSLKTALEEVDENVFEAQKNDLKNDYKNFLQSASLLSQDIFKKIIFDNYWMNVEHFEEIDRVSLDDLQKFVSKIFLKMKAQILVQGNVTRQQAEETVAKFQTLLEFEAIDYVSSEFNVFKRKFNFKICSHLSQNFVAFKFRWVKTRFV